MPSEDIEYDIRVYDNILEIIPEDPIEDNHAYEIKIDYIKADTKNKIIEDHKIEVFTKMTPLYTTIDAVESVVGGFKLSQNLILLYIRESSQMANYVSKQDYRDKEVPFEVSQFVKFRAAYYALLKSSIDMSIMSGRSGEIGEVSFDIGKNGNALKDLLAELQDEADEWKDEIRDPDFGIGAKPKSTIRSRPASYGTSLSSFSREVT